MNRRRFIQNATATSLALAGSALLAHATPTGTTYHTVAPGETLIQISRQHGIQLIDLMKTNRLEQYTIHPGQRLFIPRYSRGLDALATFRKTIDKPTKPMRPWEYIIIHHSGTKQGSAQAFDDYHRRKRHMTNGLAYHFVIGNGTGSKDGQIQTGQRWRDQLQGGHVKSTHLNKIGIGICLVGNFEKQHPTQKQLTAFTQLITHLQNDLFHNRLTIAGHRELPSESTLCPGKHFPLKKTHQQFG